jgi:hypothetical protein
MGVSSLNTTGLSLEDGTGGGLASNYELPRGQTVAASITARAVTLTAPMVSKTYDGTNSVTTAQLPTVTTGSLATGDQLSSSTLRYDTARAGSNKTTSVVEAMIVDGTNTNMNGNYTTSFSPNTSSVITPKPVVASDVVDPANVRLTPSAAAAPAGVASLIVTANSVSAPAATQDPNAPSIAPAPVSSATTPVLPCNKPSLAQQAMQGVTPKTMSQWSDAQVQSLPAPQVAALESAQLKQVLRLLDADSQIRAINPLVLPKMDLQTLAGLSNKQINALTPEQLANMTKAQINFLMPVLSPAQINAVRGTP